MNTLHPQVRLGEAGDLDVQKLAESIWEKSPSVQKGARPEIHIRRCRKPPSGNVGYAWYNTGKIVIHVWPGCSRAEVYCTLVHELTHTSGIRGHKRDFALRERDIIREAFGYDFSEVKLEGRGAHREIERAFVRHLSRENPSLLQPFTASDIGKEKAASPVLVERAARAAEKFQVLGILYLTAYQRAQIGVMIGDLCKLPGRSEFFKVEKSQLPREMNPIVNTAGRAFYRVDSVTKEVPISSISRST